MQISNSNKQEYIKWYRIAERHINDITLIPNLIDKEITKNISRNNWLMFVKATHDDRKNAINYPEPNIYLSLGENSLILGLTFNNMPSVNKFKNIIEQHSTIKKEKLVKKLIELNNSYKTLVSRKIRKYRGPAPEYETEMEIQTCTLNDEIFQNMIQKIIKIREEGKEHKKLQKYKSYFEGPSVDLARIEIKKDEADFKSVIDDLLPVYALCVGIKTDSEIKKIQKEEQKPINIKKCQNCGEPFKIDTSRTFCGKISCTGTNLEKSKIPKSEYDCLVLEGKIRD